MHLDTINTPFISIIIPTNNSAQTLKRCLESIVVQTYTNFEVWLIDNISTDDTLSIITEYDKKYSFVNYLSEKDYGIYDAMNKGINIAKGNWLYFLGSDDTLYDANSLLHVVEYANKDHVEIIYGSVVMRGENKWNLNNVTFDGEYSMDKFLNRNICHQAIFYKKTVFQKNGLFNLKYITNADFDFNLRCYANTKFTYMDLIVANFFVGGHSTTVEDAEFHKDRGALLMKYFGRRIYTNSFIKSRLYIQQAALLKSSPLNYFDRCFCLFAYLKLKLLSMLIR